MKSYIVLVNIIIFLSFFFVSHSAADDNNCLYAIYIKTGSIIKAGTDSKITLELYSKDGNGVRITDIEKWGGLMGKNYDYFERSNLDLFSGKGPCLSGPVCHIKVVSDGTGPHHGWYCDYVDVTTTGPHSGCAKQKFDVGQWLATDVSPYELTAVRNNCARKEFHVKGSTIQFVPSLKIANSV